MKTIIKLLSLALVLAALLSLFTACAVNVDVNGEGEGEYDGDGKEGETTTEEPERVDPEKAALAEALANDVYASTGYELTKTLIKDYYTLRSHWLKTEYGNSGAPAVWGAAAFIEACADAYRLYPDDTTIAKTYKDALTNLLDRYKVTNVNLKSPAGTTRGITYYNASQGNRGDYYYDDNAWICIQLFIGYQQLGDEELLAAAEANLAFLWTGWDDVLGGGIYWDKSYGGKNACSNGPTAIAFLLGYQITGNEDYLEKGSMIYDWARSKLLDGSLYIDNINKSGSRNNWKAAYNQATMIYAGAQLYEITGEQKYLNYTKATYTATNNLMFSTTGRGSKQTVRMSGNPIYKAWCVGWLARGYAKYYEVDPKKDATAFELLEKVLDNEIGTKTRTGYYDPYFCTGDWGSESVTDVLQPSGVACTFLIAGYYDCVLKQAD